MTGRRAIGPAAALIAIGVLAAALALTTGVGLAGGFSGPSGPDLKVSGAFVPQPVTAELAGGYLTVTNAGDTADELTSVTSPLSQDVTMHQSVGDEMRQVTSFRIPAHGSLTLARGGSHLMLMNLTHKPAEGERVPVTLHFAKAAPISLDVPVKAPTFNPRHDREAGPQ